jgi:peptidoglycan/xylan/chitin deacetylase (PgdA/CDA1 family)
VYRDALPLLKRYHATATAFICSKPYLEGRLLQIQKVEFLMSELGLNGFRKAFYDELERQFPGDIERESLDFAGGYRFYRYDDEPIRRFKLDLNYRLPYANVDPVLDALFENVFGPGSEAEAVRETYLGLDEIKRLVDAGIEIGVHTDSHRVMPRLDFAEQKREMETSAEFLKDITGRSEISVAYPFGFHNENTHKAAAEIGLRAGLVGGRRWIGPEDIRDRWTIPRFDVNDCFDRSTNQPLKSVLLGAALDPTEG